MSVLSDEQQQAVEDTLREVMVEDCLMDSDYLGGVIDQYIATMSLEERLEALSSELECRRDLLGFDPETGEPVD